MSMPGVGKDERLGWGVRGFDEICGVIIMEAHHRAL